MKPIVGMLVVVAAMFAQPVLAEDGAWSDPAFVFLKPETSSFWRTATNCLFEGMMDDAMNVHSTCLMITNVLSQNSIRCRYMHHQAVGFEVFRPGEMRIIGLSPAPAAM